MCVCVCAPVRFVYVFVGVYVCVCAAFTLYPFFFQLQCLGLIPTAIITVLYIYLGDSNDIVMLIA